MLGACSGGCAAAGRRDPLAWPGEDGGVGGAGGGRVVLAGDVEGEVEERLAVGFDEGGEAIVQADRVSENRTPGWWQIASRDAVCLLLRVKLAIQVPLPVGVLPDVV